MTRSFRSLRGLTLPFTLALASAVLPAGAQTVMTPGAWETTTTITRELAGKPPENMGTHTQTMCLRASFLAREPYFSADLDKEKMAARQAECSTSDYQRTGNQASWTMRCTTADGSRLVSQITNSATATTVQLRMAQDVMRPDGNQGKVTIAAQGRHVGECTEGMAGQP